MKNEYKVFLLVFLLLSAIVTGCDINNDDNIDESTNTDSLVESYTDTPIDLLGSDVGPNMVTGLAVSNPNSSPAVFTKDPGMKGLVSRGVRSMSKLGTWSDGTSISDSISSIHVAPGYDLVIYRYTNYEGAFRVLPANSCPSCYWDLETLTMNGDLNWSNRVSSIKIIATPKMLSYIKDDPSYSTVDNVNVDDIQGVANDGTYWYLTNTKRLYRIPGNKLNDKNSSIFITQLPSPINNYNHFGDLDCFNGLLYIPVTKTDSNKTPILLVLTKNFEVVKWAYFPSSQKRAGWVAVNPINGRIYSCGANGKKFTTLHVYKFSSDTTLAHLYDVNIDMSKYINKGDSWWADVWDQGGVFGNDNRFYYVLDHSTDDDSKHTGIYTINIKGKKGTAERFSRVFYNADEGATSFRASELEGIDFWDRGNSSKYPGQVHALWIDQRVNCRIDFMHYRTK